MSLNSRQEGGGSNGKYLIIVRSPVQLFMDCIVGAETGALKGVSLRDSSFSNLIQIRDLQPAKQRVTALAFSSPDQSQTLVAQLDRQLRLYDSVTSSMSDIFSVDSGEGAIQGIHVTPSEQIISCVESGTVALWSKDGQKMCESDCERGLLASTLSGDGTKLAVGGRGNLMKVLRVDDSLRLEWTAKNMKNDSLDLAAPVYETAARFLPGEDTIVTTTGTHEIRVYDPRAQRRAVSRVEWGDCPITAMALSPSDKSIVAANAVGHMANFDLRKMRELSRFAGISGAVRSLQAHSSAPFVVAASSDRFVRAFNIDTRKMVSKVYCKARLSSLLLRDQLSLLMKEEEKTEEEDWGRMMETKEGEESEGDDESDEDVWQALDGQGDAEKHTEEGEKEEEPKAKRPRRHDKKESDAAIFKVTGAENKKRNTKRSRENTSPSALPSKKKKVIRLKRKQESNEKTVTVKKRR